MAVVIVTGPPGAGKTTAAAQLAARRERAVHLEADWFFDVIAAGSVEPWKPESHPQNTAVMQIAGRAAAGYADAGYFTVVDGIVTPRWFYAPLREQLQAAGHEVAYAILRPPLAVCLERVAARPGDPFAESAVVERLWDQFTALGPLERHVVETDGLDPAQIAAALEARLSDGSLR